MLPLRMVDCQQWLFTMTITPKFICWNLKPKVMLGSRAFERCIGQEGTVLRNGVSTLRKRSLFLLPPSEDSGLSAEGCHADCTQTFLNCEKWVSAVCKPLVYSILLKQPGWTKTIPFSVTVVSAQPVWTARGTRKPTEARNGRRKCQIWVTLNDPMTFPLRHSSMWKSTQFPRLPSPDLPSDALNIPSCIHGAWTSAFLLLCSK